MKNSLKTLSRIEKFKIDEHRKILNTYLTEEERILKDLRHLFLEFEREKTFVSQNGCIGDFGAYLKRYMAFKEYLEKTLQDVRHKIEEEREMIADMFKEQKTFEIVDENRKKLAQKEEDLKDQKMLDEIGTNTYIKRNKQTD